MGPTTSTTAPASSAPAPSASASGATAKEAATKTLFVRESYADCEGEGRMKCMQVRESEGGEWTLFYDRIEGFTYEEGHAYELRVAVEGVAKPPADRSARKYRLVEIVHKNKVK